MEVVTNVENKLLKRKEVVLNIEEKEPSLKRLDIREQIAKKLKVEPNVVIVQKVKSTFGSRSVEVYAYVYEDEAALKKLTPEHIMKRNSPKAEKKEG